MDIVYIHQYYRTPAMSGGTRSYEFSRRLAARGHRVHMVTAAPTDAEADGTEGPWWTTEEAGVTVHWCAVPYSNHMGFTDRIRAFSRFAVRAARRASTLPQDLVFATSTPLTVAVPAVYSARRAHVPMVFEVRDVWPEVPIAMGVLGNPVLRRVALGLEAWAYRNAEAVITLSPGMAESVSARFPGTRVSVIPNSSDVALFGSVTDEQVEAVRARRSWLGERPLLVYTGTFGVANDVGYLVDVARRLLAVAPDIRVLLVGEGKERGELEDKARRLGVLGVNLFFEPPVPKQEVPALLAAASMCASVFADVPALRANSPNKVFDAFAAQRPVMINHEGWLAELLRESGAGLVVPHDDAERAAQAVAEHLADEQWLRDARSAAHRLATERFDRDLLFEHFEGVLRSAAARHHPERGAEISRAGRGVRRRPS